MRGSAGTRAIGCGSRSRRSPSRWRGSRRDRRVRPPARLAPWVRGGGSLRVGACPGTQVPTGTTRTTRPTPPTSRPRPSRASRRPERPDGLACERDRLDDRARLVSEDVRTSSGAGHGDEGGQERVDQVGIVDSSSTRASSPGTTSSSPASTPHARTPTRRRNGAAGGLPGRVLARDRPLETPEIREV
jgi:hypothetical protein